MKNFIILTIISVFIWSCVTNKKPRAEDQKPSIATQKKTDSADEWEITVFDAEYETFVASRAQPRSMFTESSLKSRNTILVTEWNSRFYSGTNRNFYEVAIDYDPKENYGFEFEYRMYQFFAYCNWKYGIQFNGLRGIDKLK
ncbi:DUF6146 family protein [Epilithonimonas ginsengisoli]|uniref:DUF6146 family protein n=1 Tax=Epilithonimonas ginsengisoli TaxID=1245592 RepID=A0ABU4JKQ5_9FLAO|nr:MULTISPECIES: DUF6146 family protein [Chryseobacterium group]MBV6881363.1 hypothetical protein [Epilithonimonas sp. FP105]MDW8550290.1 DUF6146 family protein [Epilithonimonas ginsengisoli]OAH64970.1 hypothetical protein AXA65_18460 [Chryseobacterium sp. FP211-J200]